MKKLLIIDANSFIHRSFHALPPFTSPEGKPTGALYGLSNTLVRIMENEIPDYAVAAFDTPEDTFRKEMYEEYKAHRPKAPDELKEQIIESENLFKKFGIEILKKPGFEADDVIGTLVEKFKDKKDLKISILTGDLDTLQLIDNSKITVLTPKRGVSNMKEYDEKAVIERFKVPPELIPDYKGLVGDSSDNIPGIRGVGPKTSEKVLKGKKSLEEVYKEIKENTEDKLEKKLLKNKKTALLSKKLATINRSVPVKVELKKLKYNMNHSNELIKYLKSLGFNSLPSRLVDKNEEQDTLFKIENYTILTPEELEKPSAETKNLLNSKKIKVSFEWKEALKNLEAEPPLFDIKIAKWLLSPDKKDYETKDKSKESLEREFKKLSKELKKKGLDKIFEEIEMPLVKVLSKMETSDIKIDRKILIKTKEELEGELNSLTKQIHKEAGDEFNINSPKQVGEIIFEKLNVKNKKSKTSSGQYRTSEEALKEIEEEHPIVKLILEYRALFKIKSTYIDPLIDMSKEGKIRTKFLQTATATGRLASEKPNLQNIPKGSKYAKNIRSSFVANKDCSLVSFDYSQLELRLLAHVSNDKEMKEAFKNNQDIHKITASKIFEKTLDKITKKERDLAKTLNFGVIYGMGSRAFSRQSGLSIEKSKEFIKKYFEDFPSVKEWQEKTIEEAKSKGFVKNLNGRIRWIRGGGFMDRAAINMPIQSLGADIIKIAMIKTQKHLDEKLEKDTATLKLSIHDELLLEISNDNLNSIIPRIKEIMEKESFSLSVPLIVDIKIGENWGNMKKYE